MSLQIQDPEDHKSSVWRFQICGPKTQGSPFLPSFDAQLFHTFSVFLADVMCSSVFSLCFQGWQREDLNLWHWWHFWHVQWHLWHLWCLWHLRHLWRLWQCLSVLKSLLIPSAWWSDSLWDSPACTATHEDFSKSSSYRCTFGIFLRSRVTSKLSCRTCGQFLWVQKPPWTSRWCS